MAKEEQDALLNERYSHRLDLEAKMAASDRAALDYVKQLSGFKRQYPEAAAEYEAAKTEEAAEDAAIVELKDDWAFHIGEWVSRGQTIVHKGVNYEVLQDHTLQADWVPGEVPALYKVAGDPGEEWPEFVQPTGAHDVYMKGAKVTFEGKHYISLIDNNSWSPAAYPAGWQLAE